MAKHGEDATSWVLLAIGVIVAFFLVARSQSLPPVVPEGAGPERFSAARAMGVVRHLTEDIGLRLNGTP